jgi:hypothetical protein
LIFVYGFDRVFDHVPGVHEVQHFSIFDAVHVLLCGDGAIRIGRWHTIGHLPGFDLQQWPVPPEIQPAVDPPNYARVPDPQLRQLHLCDDMTFAGELVHNEGLIAPQDESYFPYATGLGSSGTLEYTLDSAVRKHDRYHRFTITPRALGLWQSVIAEAKRRGIFPAARPWSERGRKGG